MKNKSLRAGQRFSLLKRPPTPDDRSFSEGEKKKRLTRPVFFLFCGDHPLADRSSVAAVCPNSDLESKASI